MEPDFPHFSLNLDFQDSQNETTNKRIKKKTTDEELERSIDDQKSVNTFRSKNLHNAWLITVTEKITPGFRTNLGTANT